MNPQRKNKLIAERLGFTLIPVEKGSGLRQDHPDYPPERLVNTETNYMISAPKGFEARLEGYSHPTEADAWSIIESVFPFNDDLNAAILLLGHDFSIQIIPYFDNTFGIYLEHRPTEKSYHEISDNIAEAISNAWLQAIEELAALPKKR